MIPFSVLDLSPITEGSTAADAPNRSIAEPKSGWGIGSEGRPPIRRIRLSERAPEGATFTGPEVAALQ